MISSTTSEITATVGNGESNYDENNTNNNNCLNTNNDTVEKVSEMIVNHLEEDILLIQNEGELIRHIINYVKQGRVDELDNLLKKKKNSEVNNNNTDDSYLLFEQFIEKTFVKKKVNYLMLGRCSLLEIAVRRVDKQMIDYLLIESIYIPEIVRKLMLIERASRYNDNILHIACQTGDHELIELIIDSLIHYNLLNNNLKQKKPMSTKSRSASPITNSENNGSTSPPPLKKSSSYSSDLSYYYDMFTSLIQNKTNNEQITKESTYSNNNLSATKAKFLKFLGVGKTSIFDKYERHLIPIDINDVNSDGLTCLHNAVCFCPSNTFEYLIEQGSNPFSISLTRESILHMIVKMNRLELLNVVLYYFMKLDDENGSFVKKYHIPKKYQEGLNTLKCVEPSFVSILQNVDHQGRNLFHYAAKLGNPEILEVLLEQYKALNILDDALTTKDNYLKVPLQIAREEFGKESEVIKLISKWTPFYVISEVEERIKLDEKERSYVTDIVESLNNITVDEALKTIENEKKNMSEWEVVIPDQQKFNEILDIPSQKYIITESSSNKSPKDKSLVGGKVKLSHFDLEQESIFHFVNEQGFPIEKHETITADGYILQMHRIPYGDLESLKLFPEEILTKEELTARKAKKRPVVFLQHGVCNSSSAWIVGGKKYSLAFMLANAGFDVWLGNNRGVQFCRKHISLSSSDSKFWKFSFVEMAKYDFPAQINYVLKYTQVENMSYVGHSQGTTQCFIGLTLYPEIQKKFNIFIALAPVLTLKYQTSKLLGMVCKLNTNVLFSALGGLGLGEIGHTVISRSFLPKFTQSVFNEAWTLLTDCDLDHTMLPILSKFEPSPTSFQNLVHWSQIIKSGKLQAFTGPSMTEVVEEYDLKKIVDVPIAIFYGSQDYLANPKDIEEYLLNELKYSLIYAKKIDGFKHNDFVWGKRAREEVYTYVLHLLVQKSTSFFDMDIQSSLSRSEKDDFDEHSISIEQATEDATDDEKEHFIEHLQEETLPNSNNSKEEDTQYYTN
ncbi:hypothetical protein ABK040_014711 [Willaertia magna]